jgi:outer membrane protein assembly factor BamA
MHRWFCACAVVICLGGATPAVAQETRAEQLERQRAERAAALEPYEPAKLERSILYIEEKRLLERWSSDVNGLYPRVGSFTSGGGIGFGAGARYRTGGGQLAFDLSGATSLKRYKVIDAAVEAPKLARGRLSLEGALQWVDFTEQDFFGVGADSRLADRTSYRVTGTDVSGTVRFRPKRWFSIGHRSGYLRPDIRSGRDTRIPSIEALFTDETAPGLEAAPNLRYSALFVDLDNRDRPRNTRSGGHYRFELGMYRDAAGGDFNFNRLDIEALHVIPIFDAKRNIALRFMLSEVDPAEAGDRVPFFLMPTIGGSTTLRGYRDLRFRDATLALFNAEYRWEALSGIDLALFFDAGDVASEWDRLADDGIKTSYGMGVRVHTGRRVFLRIDLGAGGGEGMRIFIKLGPAF